MGVDPACDVRVFRRRVAAGRVVVELIFAGEPQQFVAYLTSTLFAPSWTPRSQRRTRWSTCAMSPGRCGVVRTEAMKSGAVIDPTEASVSAMTLAERGWPSIADSSPKLCPA